MEVSGQLFIYTWVEFFRYLLNRFVGTQNQSGCFDSELKYLLPGIKL
jgi:hypothetical protein